MTRAAATAAELSFGCQLGLVLHQLASDAETARGASFGTRTVKITAWFVTAGTWIANGFCWHAVLTLWNMSHAIEEGLWTVSVGAMVPCAVYLHFITKGSVNEDKSSSARTWLKGVMLAGPLYVAFMVLVDVPMYVNRWIRDGNWNIRYLSLAEGFASASECTAYRLDAVWKKEMPWMTGYFFCAVWASLWMMRGPRFAPKTTQGKKKQ